MREDGIKGVDIQRLTLFLENGYDTPALQEQEEEANQFARELLIPQKDFEVFVMSGNCKNKASVKTFAKSLHIKTSIVVGRMMHEKLIPYTHPLRREIDKYEFNREF